MRRPRRPPTALLAAAIPVLLVAGIWLGGHPDTLPGFVRNALVGDSDGRLYEEALDVIGTNYHRSVEATEGAFEGVGMNVEEAARGLRVITVFDGSPADRGGLAPGDVITRVDGRSIAGRSTEEATALIKGKAGTKVALTVVTG